MTLPTFEVRLSAGAEDDLDLIHGYFEETRSIGEARALLHAMLERIDTLETLPDRGALARELEGVTGVEVRQVKCGRYRLIYTIFGDQVTIVIVANERQNISALLQQRLLRRSR